MPEQQQDKLSPRGQRAMESIRGLSAACAAERLGNGQHTSEQGRERLEDIAKRDSKSAVV